MKCPECLSDQITIIDRWVRQCQKCGHIFTVTRHTERVRKTEYQKDKQS